MDQAKHASTSMATSAKFDKDKGKLVNEIVYTGMTESLLFMTTSGPNIIFSLFMSQITNMS